MKHPMILLLAALAGFDASPASAGEGPCGLDVGVWAFHRDACAYADPRVYDAKYAEFERKFGQSEGVVFLWIQKGRIGVHQETVCPVRSATLAANQCRVTLACKGERPFTEILSISSPRTFTRAFLAWLKDSELRRRHVTLTYSYCGRSG